MQKENTDFMRFMETRRRMILTGAIRKNTPLYQATPAGVERERRMQNFRIEAHRAAKRQADMDRNDPFLYRRALVQLELGIHAPDELDVNQRISI